MFVEEELDEPHDSIQSDDYDKDIVKEVEHDTDSQMKQKKTLLLVHFIQEKTGNQYGICIAHHVIDELSNII